MSSLPRSSDGDPFYSSPRGTPRSMNTLRSVSGLGVPSPLDHIKHALINSRNELVLLFSRCGTLTDCISSGLIVSKTNKLTLNHMICNALVS